MAFATVRPSLLRVIAATVLLLTSGLVVSPAVNAAGTLSVTPVTWNVIGLKSNDVTVGPNKFPVGARVCNTGDANVTNISAVLRFTAGGTITLTLEGLSTLSLGTLTPSQCVDAMYTVVIPRANSSYDKKAPYQIDVTADGGIAVSTPTPRELYVEHLVSQARNTTLAIAGPGGCPNAFSNFTGCDPVPVMALGNTYTIKLYGSTSTAYGQLESFITFPNTILQVLSSSSTYTVGTNLSSTSLYSDACGWVNDPTDVTSPSYRQCATAGDTGGNVVVTYQVKAIAVGSGSATAVFYDFSGSSYHYNSDYGDLTLPIQVSDPSLPATLTIAEAAVAGVTGTYTATYTCDTTSGTVTIPAGGSVSVSVPTPPSPVHCSVAQTTRPSAPSGYTWGATTYDASSGIDILGGLTGLITIGNALSANPGTLRIDVADVTSFTGLFAVSYSCTPTGGGSATTGTVTITDGTSRTISGIPTPGSCTITAIAPPAAPAGFTWSGPSYGPQSASLPAGGSGIVALAYTLAAIPVIPVTPAPTAALTVTKTTSLAETGPWSASLDTQAGTAVWYRIVVTNTGGVALSGLSVGDSLTDGATPAGCPATGALAVGATWTCTYSVAAAEGTTTNIVTVDSNETAPATASAEVFGQILPATDLTGPASVDLVGRYAPIGLGLLFSALLVALALGSPVRRKR